MPDDGKFGRFKSVGTRASNIIAHVYATASFGLKIRIEKVGGNRKGRAVSSCRHLGLSEEEKMRFRRGEVVFHRREIRGKATNVTEIDIEKVRGCIKTPLVCNIRSIRPADVCGPRPRGGL